MSQVAAHLQQGCPPKPRLRRRHSPKLPRVIDGRTRIGRRARALARLYRERLGRDADDLLLAMAIEKTARLVALAEDLTARALRGQDIPPDDIVRLNGLCDLQLRRLRLDRHQPPATLTLAEYLSLKKHAVADDDDAEAAA